MALRWLRDRSLRFHMLGLAMLVGGWVVSVHAQTQTVQMVEKPSLVDKWLTPDVVIGGALVLLYVGELRGDLGRIKRDLDDARRWREGLIENLDERYMGQREAEARFGANGDKIATLERRIG